MGWVTVFESVVGLHAFAMFMTYPLLQQYSYRRLLEQLSGSLFPVSINKSHCSNNYTNLTIHQAVQKEMSHFHIKFELSFLFPSLVSSVLLLSYSDYGGHKVAIAHPLVGSFFFTLTFFIVGKYSLSYNSWPFLFASIFHLLNLIYVLGMLKEPQCPSVQNPTLKQNSSSQRAAAEPSPQTRCFYGVYLLFAASTRRQNVVLLLILSAFVFYKVIKNG
ncbi:solute carrier family 46 member 3 [Tachysurus ichikawai]